MKITLIQAQNNQKKAQNNINGSTRQSNFKAGFSSGAIMQGVEGKGFFISFLIQDGLGMTLPRVVTGFNRDRNITGKYNKQEGFEVLGREALTGPVIVGIAPLLFGLLGLKCKSTFTNTRLIKRIGNYLKELISNQGFNKELLKNSAKTKKEFYKHSIEALLDSNNIKKDANFVEKLITELEATEKGNGKEKKIHFANINELLNEKRKELSNEFLDLNNIYIGEGSKKIQVNTVETFRAIRDYATDAIVNNKNLIDIDEKICENIINNFAAKRFFTNVGIIAATLTSLAYLPMLYIREKISPGAKLLLEQQKKAQEENSKVNDNNTNFKANSINNKNLWARIGKFLTKDCFESIQSLLEFSGINFSKTTFALLATIGILGPRAKMAWDRAIVDKNGKKDYSEINEILTRDLTSSLSVVFAVPLLTKLLVKSYENKTGFILTNRATDNKNWIQKALAIINPYSKLQVLSLSDINAIYGNLNNVEKINNFADFVSNKGGDLDKILRKSAYSKEFFTDNMFKYSKENLSRIDKNKEILSFIKNIKTDKEKEILIKILEGATEINKNSIAKFARNLNSWPGLISTFILSPVLLGVLIPKLTYSQTRKANERKMKEF